MPHDLMNLGPPTDLVAETAVRTAGAVAFTEGPAVEAEGSVFFSDIVNNRIMRRAPDGTLSVWRADSGRANGNMFDAQGRLVTCEGAEFGDSGRRRITRTDMRTGAVEVLTDRYEGKRYNSPNDLVIDVDSSPAPGGNRKIWALDINADLKTLYVVSGKSLFSIRVNVAGHVVYPRPRG